MKKKHENYCNRFITALSLCIADRSNLPIDSGVAPPN